MASITIHITESELAAIDREAKKAGTSRHAVAKALLRAGLSQSGVEITQRSTKSSSSEKARLNQLAYLERRAREAPAEERHAAFLELASALEEHWGAAKTERARASRWDRLTAVYAGYMRVAGQEAFAEAVLRLLALGNQGLTHQAQQAEVQKAWSREVRRRKSDQRGKVSA